MSFMAMPDVCWLFGYQLWTIMHLANPRSAENDETTYRDGHECTQTRILNALSPPNRAACPRRRFAFSMYYTTAHVFALMNAIIYWAILVPAGHGGFKPPTFPHHHHNPGNATMTMYNPGTFALGLRCCCGSPPWRATMTETDNVTDKGLFDEDGIKAFSIINVWSITAVIAILEVGFLNSIRRQSVSSISYSWRCKGIVTDMYLR
jgi:hypothetical protein